MPLFQISSRTVKPPGPPKKHPTHVRRQWYAVLRVACGLLIIGLLIALSRILELSFWFFVLLPVGMSIITARSQLYNRNALLLTACVAIIYFGGITALQLLIHSPSTPEIIVVNTTLFMAVLFEPVRARVQAFMEQRFHLRDDAIKAIAAFTSTLREEIDLDQLRERFLDVVQKTMQPQSVSMWVSKRTQDDTKRPPTQAGWGKHDQQIQCEGRTQEGQGPAGELLYWIEPSEVNVAHDDPFMAYALRHPDAVEVDRLQLDSPVLHTLKTNGVEIALPLVSQGELLGLLNLGSHLNEQKYTREERSLLNTLAAQVAPALRVAQMVQAQHIQVRERERIEQELRTAQHIQQSLLPKEVPELAGWRFAPYYQPAREVGGDFYDFLPFEDGQLGIVIGDVTGKGVSAALVMATTCTMLRTATQATTSPSEVLARVNDLLSARIPPGMFVTCFYAILDPRSGRLRYANAGQDWPFRRCGESVSELQATGMPLGMMPGTRYEEQAVTLLPDESILLYSDGLVEAHNLQNEIFGLPHLKALIEAHPGNTTLIDFLLGELTTFGGADWEQEDDVTLVLVQREPLTVEGPGEEQCGNGWSTLGAWTIPSVLGNERQAMALVTEVLQPQGLSMERMACLESAVAETVMNAMEHGNQYQPDQPVSLQVRTSKTAIMVRIRDEGGHRPMPAVDEFPEPDLLAKLAERQAPRGWGLFLIHNLVDEVHVSGDDQHHIVELVMHLETPGSANQQSVEQGMQHARE